MCFLTVNSKYFIVLSLTAVLGLYITCFNFVLDAFASSDPSIVVTETRDSDVFSSLSRNFDQTIEEIGGNDENSTGTTTADDNTDNEESTGGTTAAETDINT